MTTTMRCLFICGLLLGATTRPGAGEDRGRDEEPAALAENETFKTVAADARLAEAGRSIGHGYEEAAADADLDPNEPHAAFKRRAKPLKNIFMGIYKNYKSTYLGNRTSQDYKKNLRDRLKVATHGAWPVPKPAEAREEPEEVEEAVVEDLEPAAPAPPANEDDGDDDEGEPEEEATEADVADRSSQEEPEEADVAEEQKEEEQREEDEEAEETSLAEEAIEFLQQQLAKKQRKLAKAKTATKAAAKSGKRAKTKVKVRPPAGGDDPLVYAGEHEFRYHVGPGLNLSLDMRNDVVDVKLDGDSLRELVAGRWLGEDSVQGRGKKYEMVSKVLPLFIIPFLIQSAIVPFLVTKLKLLLMKSMLVGKLAIFLLVVSAIRNSNKMMQTYEVAPSYWAGEPSRRSEMAAAASGYSGYRVEGKPAAWVN